MLRFAANLTFLFNELPFLDRFEAAAAQHFKLIEFMLPYDWPVAEIKARLDANGLAQVLFNTAQGRWAEGERGIAALPGREAEFDTAVEQALGYSRVLGNKLIHVMAGLEPQGASRATFVGNLRRGAERAAADGLTLVIEPINPRDMPGYFLTRTRQALDILADAGANNLGLQFDFYHRAIVEGDVEAGFKEAFPMIRHIQIAAPPDRGEPDQGDLDYRAVLKMVDESGYSGAIGLEYKPRAGTAAGLSWIKALGPGSR